MKQKFSLIFLLTGILLYLSGFTPFADGRSVDIDNNRKMFLVCQGDGSPTVVFISGRSDSANIWQTLADTNKPGPDVYHGVAKFTRVCAYDRPGTFTILDDKVEPSRSSSTPQPITPKDSVADLHAMLTVAKVPSPYILVGHSFGGLIARLYAATYPNEVVGLVLIDTLTEFLYDALSPAQQEQWIRLNSNYSPDLDKYAIQEKTDFIPSFTQLRNASTLRSMPAIVLTSDQPFDFKELIAKGILPEDTPINFGPIVFQAHLTGQERLASLLNAKQITNTHAGHYIQTEQPQLIIDSIREVVDNVRKIK